MDTDWKFLDPTNVSVFASKKIVFEYEWIYYVYHHAEDGAWEFHPKSGITSESEIAVVGLKTILDLDNSIDELYDLPLGWCAWRDEKDSQWIRQKMD